MHSLIVDDFYPKAKSLRRVFDAKFADPLATGSERFVWDFWHVPGGYTHLRTPAFHYFPKQKYEAFHRFLVRWGRENLGCHDISPPWLSCYITGCKQEPHRDRPHGPLAFVYSLSRGGFRGGETFIENPGAGRKEARGGRPTLIVPKFNRLALFNPSLSHGVREVTGTMDPRRGRLVIHGWFVQPRPFWVGPLTVKDVSRGLDAGLRDLPSQLGEGLISLRMEIGPGGRVRNQKVLINTLMKSKPASVEGLLELTSKMTFASRTRPTRLTLPLVIS